MELIVFPSRINGCVIVPASKSVTQRALVLALLHEGKTVIQGIGNSDDEISALQAIEKLGATIQRKDNTIIVTGISRINFSGELNCGESGLLLRLLTMICSTSHNKITLTGSGSLLKREMHFFEKHLPTLGVAVTSVNGKLPVSICGPMQVKDTAVDGSDGSQYISGLLMAFAKQTDKAVSLNILNAVSKPYLDITWQMMQKFGYNVSLSENNFNIYPANKNSETINCDIEGDWSSAAFLLVAAAIAGEAVIKGLNPDSAQGDIKLMHILAYCGVNAVVFPDAIFIPKPHFLYAFSYDATDTPDLFPPLVALACNCNGQTVIKGVHRLVNKESNRAISLLQVFKALGADIYIQGDEMIIQGKLLKGGTVDSFNDHRVVMAASVAALTCHEPVIIKNAEAVKKSYPDFFNDIQVLGATVSITA